LWGKDHTLTARYNFTQDWRDIPVTGGALCSSLQPHVRTQNFSTFLTTSLSNSMSNVLILSYGRTQLNFQELRYPLLIPSQRYASKAFLLNRPRIENDTINSVVGVANTGPVLYRSSGTTECALVATCDRGSGIDRVGQVNIAGFSPLGVD